MPPSATPTAAQPLAPPPTLAVVHTHGAYSLVTAEPVTAGRLLFTLEGELTPRPSRYSVQVGRDLHIDVPQPTSFEVMTRQYPWRFMNHSCEPSARIEGRTVIALREIPTGEQITFNYNTTEWELAEAFTCHCGSAGCQGEIRGYRFLSPQASTRLSPTAADHLTQR